jgi:hypothetical protein
MSRHNSKPILPGITSGDDPDSSATVTATPAALALYKNFLSSITSLKRSLIRSIHYLRVIYDRKVYRMLGYSTITEYASVAAGISRNQTEAFLALGKKLEQFPEVKQALGQGELSWTKARIIVSNADPAEQREWVELAGKVSAADLRKRKNHNNGSKTELPSVGNPNQKLRPAKSSPAPPRPYDEKCYVAFKFSPEEYSRWSTIMESLRKQGRRDSKEQLILAGLTDLITSEGQASGAPGYLLHIHQCPECNRKMLHNSRGTFEVEPALLKAADCDAIVERADGSRRANIAPRLRRLVLARDGHCCQRPGCGQTRFLEIHHRIPVSSGGRTEMENLVTLCSGCQGGCISGRKSLGRPTGIR